MGWSWKVFFIVLLIVVICSMFSRGAMNAQNIVKYGPEADWRYSPSKAFFGSVLGGGIWAAIITVVIGLF